MKNRHLIRDSFTRALLLVGLSVAMLVFSPTAHGQTNIFKAGNTTDISSNTSWTLTNGTAPTTLNAGDFGIFNSTINATVAPNININGSLTLGGLQVTNPGAAITIQNTTVMQTFTIGNASILGNPTLFTALPYTGIDMSNANQNLTLGANVSVVLAAGQNWYVGNSTSHPTLTVNGPLSLGVNQLYTVGTGNYNIAGNISGSGLLVVDSTGTTILSGTNTNSGGVLLGNGTLQIGSATALGTGVFQINSQYMQGTTNITTANNTIVDASSSLIQLDGNFNFGGGSAANLILSPNAYLGQNITANISGNAVTFSGSIVDGGTVSTSNGLGITKTGTGTLTLAGANTFSGNLNLQVGTLSITNNSALQNAILNYTGGTLTFGPSNLLMGGVAGTQNIALVAGSNLTITTVYGHDATYSGNLTGGNTTSALTINGSAVQAFSGFSNYTGTTTLNSGTLAINGGGSATAGPIGATASTLVINGGSLDNTSGGTVSLLTNNKQNWNGNFTFAGTNSLSMGSGLVTLGQAATTVTVNSNTLTEGGIITGAGDGLIKAGSYGTLDLIGASNYTGGTTVNAGTLIIGTNGSSFGAGTFNINSGGTLEVDGSVTMTGNTNLNTDGTLNFNNSASIGTGTLVINGGTLDNTSGGNVTNANNNAQRWNGNFTFGGSGNLNIGTGAVTLLQSETLTLSSDTLTVGGIISGSALGLTLNGTGSLVLNGANTYTGATVLTAGTQLVNGTLAGATLTVSGNNHAETGATTVNSGAQLNFNSANAIGTGALNLAGNTSISGIIWGASLDNTSGGNITNANNNAINVDGVVNYIGSGNLSLGTGAVALGSNSTFNVEASTLTVGGVVSGSFGLTKNGTGTLVLANTASTYTGFTDINGGTLSVSTLAAGGAASSIGESSNAALNLVIANNGTLQYTGSGSTTDRNFTMGMFTSTIDASGTGALVFNSSTNGNINFNPASPFAVNPDAFVTANTSDTLILTGNNGNVNTLNLGILNNGAPNFATNVVKNGTGEWALGGNNTYSGQTILNTGTLSLTNGGNINESSIGLSTLVINGGTLDNTSAGAVTLGTNNAIQLNNSFGFAGTKALSLGTGSVTLGNSTAATITMANTAGSTLTLGGVIGDNGLGYSLTLAGGGASGGTLVLAGSNTFSGNMNVTGGTLSLGSTTSLQNAVLNQTAGNVTFAAGTNTLGGLAGSVNIASTALSINSAKSLNTTYTGVISGTSSFTMTGTGSEDLTSAQTYTGGTTVSGGTLIESGANNFGTGGLTINGGFLTLNGTTNTLSGTVAVSGGTANFTTTVTDAAGAWNISGGTLILGGTAVNSGMTGAVNLSGGNLDYNKSEALGTGTFTITGGTLDNTNGTFTNAATDAIHLNSNLVFQGTNNLDLGTGAVTLNASHSITVNANTLTMGGIVSGATFSLTKAGAGTLILSGANTYSGGTLISAGTLIETGLNNFGTGGVTVSGGNLVFNGTTTTLSGTVAVSAGTANFTTTVTDAAGAWNVTGGNLILGGTAVNSAMTGTVTLSGGTLDYNKSRAVGTGTLAMNGGTLDNTNGTFTNVATNAIAWNNNFTFLGTNSLSLGTSAVTMNASHTLTISANTLSIGGIISGAGFGLTLNGSGTLDINGATSSTYTGATTINGGTLQVDFRNAAAAKTNLLSASSALALGGGTLQLLGETGTATTNSQTFNGATINSGASQIVMTPGTDTTLTLALGAITRSAGGTVNISSAATTGNVVTTSSTTHVEGGIITSGVGTGSAFLTVGGTDWGAISGSDIIKLASYTAGTTNSATIWKNATPTNVQITASPTGGSIATTSAINSLQYNDTVTASTITLAGSLVINTGGILVSSADTVDNTITGGTLEGSASGELVVIQNSAANLTIASVIANNTGATGVTKSGTGRLILSGANTYNGTTTLNQGTLAINNNNAIGTGTGTQIGSLVINGGTLDNTSGSNVATTNNVQTWNNSFGFAGSGNLNLGTGAVTLGQNVTVTTAGATTNLTVGGIIGGSGLGLTETGTGTLVLAGANTYTGGTTVTGGTLNMSGANNFGVGGFNVSSGTMNVTGATNTFSGTVNVSGGTANFTTTITDTAGAWNISGGTLLLGGTAVNSGMTGAVNLSGGNLDYNKSEAVGTGTLTISGGTLDNTNGTFTNAATNAVALNGNFSFAGTNSLNLGTGATTLGANVTITTATAANNLTIGGVVTGSSLGITAGGTGNLVLSGANTYTGGTTVNGGTLDLTGSGAYGTGTFTVNGGTMSINNSNTMTGATTLNAGTLDLNNAAAIGTGTLIINGGNLDNTSGAAITTSTNNNAIQMNGNFTFAGSNGANSDLNLGTGAVALGRNETITTSNAASTLTVGGAISGGYSLIKAGAGDLVLNGASTYTGGTIINAGTLEANNTSALGGGTTHNTVTVNNSATLQLDSNFNSTTGTSNSSLLVLNGSGNGTAGYNTGALLAGATSTWAGNISLGSNAVISAGNGTANTLTLGNGGLDVPPTYSNISLGSNTLTFTGGASGNILSYSQITGSGGIVVNMTAGGVVDLNGFGDTFTGSTVITNGTLLIDQNQNSPPVSVSDGNLTSLSGPVTIGTGVGSTANAILQIGSSSIQAKSPLADTTNITVNSDGEINMYNGASQEINTLTMNQGGLVTFGGGGSPQLIVEGNINVNGGSNTAIIAANLVLTNTNGNSLNDINVTRGSTTSDLTINAVVTGGSILKTGNGIVTLSNSNNTYFGTTEIAAGTLAVNASSVGANSPLGTSNSNDITNGTLVDNGGQLQLQNGITINSEALTLNGNGTNGTNGALMNQSGNNTWNGTIYVGANTSTVAGASNATINTDAGNLTIQGNVTTTSNTPTLTIMGNNTTTTLSGIVSGALNLNITANGNNTNNVVMSGSNVNTYTGNTTINANTTLTLARTGANNNSIAAGTITVNQGGTLLSDTTQQINIAANMNLNGGTWQTAATGAFTEQLGTLTLSMSSNLTLGNVSTSGTTSNVINFAASNLNTWTPGASLYINDWNGTFATSYTNGIASNGGGGMDQVLFGSSSGGLLLGSSYTGQLGDIVFVDPMWNGVQYNGDYNAVIESNGEVVPFVPFLPAPEPGTVAAGASLAVLAGLREWRKRKNRAVAVK